MARTEVPDVLETAFGRTITRLSTKHQLPCTVYVLQNRPPYAEARSIRRRIYVTAALLDEPDDEQAWTAAHEFGHLISARRRGLAYHHWAYLTLAAVATLLGLAPSAALWLVRAPLSTAGWSLSAIVSTIVGVCWGLAALGFHLALLARARHQRPLEREADLFAADEGHPMSPAVVDMLVRHEGPRQSRASNRYRTHLPPHQRAQTAGGSTRTTS